MIKTINFSFHNGITTAEGTYQVRNDSILLTYAKEAYSDDGQGRKHANEILIRILTIDKVNNRIHSVEADKNPFCATININKLK